MFTIRIQVGNSHPKYVRFSRLVDAVWYAVILNRRPNTVARVKGQPSE